jgi:hypothetical protein
MIGRLSEWILTTLFAGLVAAAAFGMTAEPLAPLGPLSISFYLSALVMFLGGALIALALVDLKRAFTSVLVSTFVATIIYGAALMTPAISLGHYTNHLWNYALVQSVPVVIITLVATATGAIAGTFINTSIREIDL